MLVLFSPSLQDRDPNRVIVVGNRADSLNTRQLQQVNEDAKRLYRKDEILFTCSAAALTGQHDWDGEELAVSDTAVF